MLCPWPEPLFRGTGVFPRGFPVVRCGYPVVRCGRQVVCISLISSLVISLKFVGSADINAFL